VASPHQHVPQREHLADRVDVQPLDPVPEQQIHSRIAMPIDNTSHIPEMPNS
jgi:hypothetical protein